MRASRARDAHELESLQLFGACDVWASAQVEKFARVIDADLVALDLVSDQLELVVLPPFGELLDGLVARESLLHERPVLVSDAAHARLDRGQVRLRDRPGEREVVVEAVLDRGTDAVLGIGVQLGDGRRQQVCGRVPQDVQRIVAEFVLAVFGHGVVQYM